MKTEVEKLIDNTEYMSEKQAKLMNNVIRAFTNRFYTIGDILKIATGGTDGSIDTAIPLNYQRRIEDIHPNFKSHFHVYDYRTNKYGEMMNVAEEFVSKIHNTFKS